MPSREVCRGNPEQSVNRDGFSWSTIDNTKACGIVLVMISLSWWGMNVTKVGADPERVKDWRDAVSEVRFAFSKLAIVKEAAAEEEEDENEVASGTGSQAAPLQPKRKRCVFDSRSGDMMEPIVFSLGWRNPPMPADVAATNAPACRASSRHTPHPAHSTSVPLLCIVLFCFRFCHDTFPMPPIMLTSVCFLPLIY